MTKVARIVGAIPLIMGAAAAVVALGYSTGIGRHEPLDSPVQELHNTHEDVKPPQEESRVPGLCATFDGGGHHAYQYTCYEI